MSSPIAPVPKFRWRFYQAQFVETSRQIRLLSKAGFYLGLFRLGWRLRWPRPPIAPPSKPWPRTAALATAFGQALVPVVPEGFTVTGGSGKALHFTDARRGGGGFIGMGGSADMPQVQPKDLAKELQNAMKTLDQILRRRHGSLLDGDWPDGRFRARAEGDSIRCWWQLPDGSVTKRLANISLAELHE